MNGADERDFVKETNLNDQQILNYAKTFSGKIEAYRDTMDRLNDSDAKYAIRLDNSKIDVNGMRSHQPGTYRCLCCGHVAMARSGLSRQFHQNKIESEHYEVRYAMNHRQNAQNGIITLQNRFNNCKF